MNNKNLPRIQMHETFALDILIALLSHQDQASFSYQNEQLSVDDELLTVSSEMWLPEIRDTRATYLLEKTGLPGADLTILGTVWLEALQKTVLSGKQLKDIGLNNLSIPTAPKGALNQWRRMFDARLFEAVPDLDAVEQLSFTQSQKDEQPLELAPLLHAWPERLLNHPDWSCAESPLPEIPPLPLDEIWVDLYLSDPFEDYELEEGVLYQLQQRQEQRYRESQWLSMPADFIVESLKGTTVLVGAPGIGKTTLLKWIARRLIKQAEGRFLLPLFVPLRAYVLSKKQNPDITLPEFSLRFCGVQSDQQIDTWSTMISYLSGPERNTVLLLLDGWDEVPNEMREELNDEIKHLGYAFSMIITSRPSAYPKSLSFDQIYEISDLPPENISTLVQQWHKLLKQPQQADVLLDHLKNHPDLSQMARNPFLLNLLCAINMEGNLGAKILPRNRTELYKHTLKHIYNYQTNNSIIFPFTPTRKKQIQKLALWLLTEAPNYPQYLFGSQEVEQLTGDAELLPKVLLPSRLLSQWHLDKESLHFLHTSFQEYLAAEALLKLDQDKRKTLILRELHNPAWQEILRFIAGKNSNAEHDYWQILRQLSWEPDQCGLIDIRLSLLVSETVHITDGGKALLGFDLRSRLWEHIKSGIGTHHFVRAYAQLDPEDYINRVENIGEIQSKRLKARLIRSLGTIPTRKSSQALIDHLLSGNKNDAAVASYAVRDVLDVAGLQMLRSALQEKILPIDIKQILIRALGNSKDYVSIPFLVKLHTSSPALRREILQALGRIGGQQVAVALANFLKKATTLEDRQDVIHALGHAADLPSRDILIMELAKIMPDDPLLGNILDALCEIPLSRHSDLISIYLQTDFAESIRVKAIWALMEATETHVVDKLARLGELDASEKVRIAALAAIRKRSRSLDLSWLSARVKNEECNPVERANALEAVLGLYKRAQRGQLASHLDHSSLHKQTLDLCHLALRHPSTDINLTAAAGSFVLGKDIAPTLLDICGDKKGFPDSVKESACISLGKIRYKPALKLFNKWIERSPDLADDEDEPLMNVVDRLARAAAQAYVQTDLIGAIRHKSQTMRGAISKFSLETGTHIFPDRIITPTGKVIKKIETEHLKDNCPKLNPNIVASRQKTQLRIVCQYLFDNHLAKKSGHLPEPESKDLIPLFKDSSLSNTFTDHLITSINKNTGRKLLEGESISDRAAITLMAWLKKKFPYVFEQC